MKKIALISAIVTILFGCGMSKSDSGLDINCPTYNLWDHGGPVLATPKVHIIFWGNWWLNAGSSYLDLLSTAWITLVNDPNFYFRMAEYGVGPGHLVGIFNSNLNLAQGSVTEVAAQTELQSEIKNGLLPLNDDNSIYMILLPLGNSSQNDLDEHFAAHHASVNGIVYGLVDFNTDLNFLTEVTSHEIYESSTDPFGTGWLGSPGETEIGDYCEASNYWLDGYNIQTLWSQTQCQCVPDLITDAGE